MIARPVVRQAFGRLVLGIAAVAVLAVGCSKSAAPDRPEPLEPQDIKDLVQVLEGKVRGTTMGYDTRELAAMRLGDLGPPAKEYGAVAPLRRLTTDKNPAVAAAATAALAKIEGK